MYFFSIAALFVTTCVATICWFVIGITVYIVIKENEEPVTSVTIAFFSSAISATLLAGFFADRIWG